MADIVKTERIGKTQQDLLEKAKGLPTKPGCYLMKNREGQVIYVGKAKNLRSRVSSYFQSSAKSAKTEVLVGHIRDFDFLRTNTDTEAFVLENNLIKKHTPKYNIRLRDDKSYPYVLVDHSKPFPRLQYVRRVKREEGKEVYGPFVTGSRISEVLRVLTKSFGLRDCSLREFHSRKEPCLLFQMKQCSAPCVGKISEEDYQQDLQRALDFFRGEAQSSLDFLNQKMLKLAEEESFEHAAMLRDQIQLLEEFQDKALQKNAEFELSSPDVDVMAYHKGETEVDMAIYLVRNGVLLGHKNFHLPLVEVEDDVDENLLNFLMQYYLNSHDTFPQKLVTPFTKKQNSMLQEGLKEMGSVQVVSRSKGLLTLVKLAQDQAREHQRFRLSNEESTYVGLNRLGQLLELKERPRVLECFDVAVFQGTSPTAAQIVFHEGKPMKSSYRHYHLEERPEGNNDFAMMKEMLSRRLKHGDFPDVFIVDGGKGQVSIFQGVLKDLNVDVPVVGLAKAKTESAKGNYEKELSRSDERLIIPGRSNPYILSKCRSLFKILVSMRDEAHRFSRRLHHKQEGKRVVGSWLDQVPGIGPKTKQQILKTLEHGKEELREMSALEISNLLSIKREQAQNILNYLNSLS